MAGSIDRPVKLGWILGAMALGLVLGLLVDDHGRLLGSALVPVGGFLGAAFLGLLKMVVVPLVMASVVSGVAGLGNARDLGRLGLLSLLFYVVTTLIAVAIALALVNFISPGIIDGQPAQAALALHGDVAAVSARVQEQAGHSVGDIVLDMIPVNVVAAAADGKLIGLLLFSLLFGWFITQLEGPPREVMTHFWQALFGVMLRMTGFVMKLAPLGVLGLTLKVTAETGFDAARPLLLFALCVVVGLALYAGLALPLLLALVARVRRPWRLYAAVAPALATAFSTASSAASLPVTLECLQKRAGVGAYRRRYAAAGRFHQPCGQRAVRMRGGAVHRAGLRVASFHCHAGHGGTPGADHQHGHRQHSGRIAGGYRRDPGCGGSARRSHWRAAGTRPRARHGAHRRECRG